MSTNFSKNINILYNKTMSNIVDILGQKMGRFLYRRL